MIDWVSLASAFVVGLLGGVHCVGMCGGIVAALTFGLPAERRQRVVTMLPTSTDAYSAWLGMSWTFGNSQYTGSAAMRMSHSSSGRPRNVSISRRHSSIRWWRPKGSTIWAAGEGAGSAGVIVVP